MHIKFIMHLEISHKNYYRCNKNCNSVKRQTVVKSAIKWLVITVTKSLIKHLIRRLFDWLF